MKIDESEIQRIIGAVNARLGTDQAPPSQPMASNDKASVWPVNSGGPTGMGAFADVDQAVAAARQAYHDFHDAGLETRKKIVEAMREAARREGRRLAYEAHAETGLGRAEDKVIKNSLVTERTPGPEDLEPHAETGEGGVVLTEYAPYGVIGSITPTTNPTSTIINNAIAILSAGNAVTFNVHPSAKTGVRGYDQYPEPGNSIGAGGPANLITCVAAPTMDSANQLMNHPDVAVLLVTGGPGVVQAALKTNKKAITAGPGNPPAVVDDTADIDRAARDIVTGASFDNNVICVDEKTTIVLDCVADQLIRSMQDHGAYLLKEHEMRKLEKVIFKDRELTPGRKNPLDGKWVGQDAGKILAEIGIRPGFDVKLVIAEVPNDHPLVWSEQLMPVMPVTRVHRFDDAVDLAVRSEHGYRHTASIHSSNIDRITSMARAMNCSIFVANGPNVSGLGSGGEGFTSFSIASPTGEGLSRPRTFSRIRRLSMVGALRVV